MPQGKKRKAASTVQSTSDKVFKQDRNDLLQSSLALENEMMKEIEEGKGNDEDENQHLVNGTNSDDVNRITTKAKIAADDLIYLSDDEDKQFPEIKSEKIESSDVLIPNLKSLQTQHQITEKDDQMVEVFLTRQDDKTVSIEVLKDSRVEDVILQIEDVLGIPRSKQILKFKGKILIEHHSLNFYGIKDGNAINVSTYIEITDEERPHFNHPIADADTMPSNDMSSPVVCLHSSDSFPNNDKNSCSRRDEPMELEEDEEIVGVTNNLSLPIIRNFVTSPSIASAAGNDPESRSNSRADDDEVDLLGKSTSNQNNHNAHTQSVNTSVSTAAVDMLDVIDQRNTIGGDCSTIQVVERNIINLDQMTNPLISQPIHPAIPETSRSPHDSSCYDYEPQTNSLPLGVCLIM
jgi:hypothetical protein